MPKVHQRGSESLFNMVNELPGKWTIALDDVEFPAGGCTHQILDLCHVDHLFVISG